MRFPPQIVDVGSAIRVPAACERKVLVRYCIPYLAWDSRVSGIYTALPRQEWLYKVATTLQYWARRQRFQVYQTLRLIGGPTPSLKYYSLP